jgi:hypothetical protein
MKNRPLLLTLVCLGLGALVWYDNQPAEDAKQRVAAPAPGVETAPGAADESEPASSAKNTQPAGDANEQAHGDSAEPAAIPESTGGESAGAETSGSNATGPETPAPAGTDTEAPAGSETAAAPQSGNPLASLDKSTLKDWVERPLFAPSRKRPPPTEASQGPAPQVAGAKPPPPIYELLGIVRDKGRAIALLRKKADGTSFRVQVGDTLGGWQVSKVDPKAVTLIRDDGTSETMSIFRE